MNIEDMLDINDCPLCDGGALLEEECGCGYYVMCMECGCHSVTIDFHSEEERLWPPKGQLCFGIREKLFQAVRENDFITVKCLFTAELLHFVLQNVMTNITICDNISR